MFGYIFRAAFVVLVAFLASGLYSVHQHRQAYVALSLAPRGGGVVKDLIAYGLLLIPRLQRLRAEPLTDEQRYKRAEGFHTNMEFNSMGGHKMRDSTHFAENFYFWATKPKMGEEDTVFTTRLSFTGVNASHVVPWFAFLRNGEDWSLPPEFEQTSLPYDDSSDEKVCLSPDLGELRFTCTKPMGEWRIRYKGLLEKKDTAERKKVEVNLIFSFTPDNVFYYQRNWDEMAAARAMAAKVWDSSFWKNLRSQYQERYMSLATGVTGTVQFEDGAVDNLGQLVGSRDHNFGSRNWRFIWRYIWWPGVHFTEPLEIEGIKYAYLTGSFAEYGNTFENIVVGGLMSNEGECASFSGATPMRDIAPEWYDKIGTVGQKIGHDTIPGKLNFQIAILQGKYIVDIKCERGHHFDMWEHSFMMQGGTFEVHEALTRWYFTVRATADPSRVVARATSTSLLEFGGNVAGLDDEH